MKKTPTITICLLFLFLSLQAQETTQDSIPKKIYFTKAIKGQVPNIDGILDDPIWETVAWGGDFTQRSPFDGETPTQKTAFKILYDAKNLYIAYRCFDTEPEKIVSRMSRRDGFEGDWVEINIDSYYDKRTAFSFTLSVSGVRGDEFISNNGNNWDSNWNPIWYSDTNIDEQGWTGEVRIPLSQIRYGNKEEHVWGLQFTRRDFREESRSVWQYLPQNNGNWVSSFGELHGLVGLVPQRQIELQPYVLGQTESFEKEEGNPFATGSDQSLNVGLDGKIGVTSDLTLDFTINPDFGQVEADPSALNLDGFRVFFSERRPFFIENRNLFDYRFGSAEAGGPHTIDNLFYSRRIGSSPHRYPDLNDDEYADVPTNTSILGAAKFSGKTKKGLGIGILESVTAQEMARIDHNGEVREEVVEPLTNFFVGRITQDFREGETVIGGIFTAVNRDLENTGMDFLHRSAYSGGVDVIHWWKDRTYFVSANGVFSRVNGSTESILRTQKSFEHYFQRPDADHLELDPNATSLTGHGGTVKVGKLNGNWIFETGVNWRSPELELNDIGFMTNADEISYFLWSGYRINKPFSIFRNIRINYNHFARWDFGGNNIYQAVSPNFHTMFNNFWGMGTGITYENKDIDNNALFGGPALRKSRGVANWVYAFTDNRKAIRFNLNLFNAWGFEKGLEGNSVRIKNYSLGVTIQPSNAFNISIRPSYNINTRLIQNVTSLDFRGETRYIAGTVDQRTLSMTMRLNYNITPNLTLQYYGQPFVSRGRYSEFKYITNSLDKDFFGRFHQYSDAEISFDEGEETFYIDENLDGETDYTFDKPDFNFMQFRSNFVARWEYIPGSEVFFVWSQSNTVFGDPQDDLWTSITDRLFDENKPHNIFLVKLTYRFLL